MFLFTGNFCIVDIVDSNYLLQHAACSMGILNKKPSMVETFGR